MRVLDEVDLSGVQYITNKDAIKENLSKIFWEWFDKNEDMYITKISLFRGLVKKKIYVRDLEPIFKLLFG